MELYSIFGIIAGLALLIVLVLKGVSLYIAAPASAAVVALLSGMNVLDAMSNNFMESFANFAKSYFLLFMLSSIFAKVMSDSGVAKMIAQKISKLVKKCPARYRKFVALISLCVVTSILTLGGINLYCCVFVLVAIFRDLFEEFDIPWHLYMVSSMGTGSFTMSMFPGTPAIQNLIPIEILGTTAAAAPVLGSISSVICIALSLFYIWYALGKAEKKQELFLPTGARVKALALDEDDTEQKIPLLVGLLPSIALFAALNAFGVSAVGSMFLAIVLALILFGKSLYDKKVNIFECFTEGAKNAIMVVATMCVVVGFGGVVSATSGYTLMMESLEYVPGSAIMQLIIAVNLAAGATGSASAGLSVGLNLFGERFIDAGMSPDIIHRLSVMSSGGLDTLPHSSGTASALGVAQLTHKEGYMHVFWLNTVIPIIVVCIAGVLAGMGIC